MLGRSAVVACAVMLYLLAFLTVLAGFCPRPGLAYGLGLGAAIVFAGATYFGDLEFEGVASRWSPRGRRWAFLCMTCALAGASLATALFQGSQASTATPGLLAQTAIGLLLVWSGSILLYGSRFLGSGVHAFARNPFSWLVHFLFGKRK